MGCLRSGYFLRNREYIAAASPIVDCLTEDPIQVMFTGRVDVIRDRRDKTPRRVPVVDTVTVWVGIGFGGAEKSRVVALNVRLAGGVSTFNVTGITRGATVPLAVTVTVAL